MSADLIEAGKQTQFGAAKGNPRSPEKAWSIRGAQRYLSTQEIDPTIEKPFEKSLGNVPKVKGTQLLAARALDRALAGDSTHMRDVVDNIEGKLPQTTINADFEKIKSYDDNELLSFITSGFTEIAAVGSGDTGSEETGNNASSPEETPETDPAASVPEPVATEKA